MSVANILNPVLGTVRPSFLPPSGPAGVQTITAGNGITIAGTQANPVVQTNLAGAGGITISYPNGVATITDSKNDVSLLNGANGNVNFVAGNANTTINISSNEVLLTALPAPIVEQTFKTGITVQNPAGVGTSNGANSRTLVSFTLPSEFNSCNVFTFYVNNLSVSQVSASTSFNGTARIYPSDTQGGNGGVGLWDSNEGAMSYYLTTTGLQNGSNFSVSNIEWNWRPTNPATPRTIYINVNMGNDGGRIFTGTTFECVVVGSQAVLT